MRVYTNRPAPLHKGTYGQTLGEGYQYLTTRDGTKLAINVRLPGPIDKGPYPTVVEYSGYGYARPSGAESGISVIGNLIGFAVVDVNMRGTGCSGGAFDYFEPNQALDGYDVIETVARQSWALHHKVGMMGISYGGISQLFVGQTNPPSLAAITPLSVIDNTATTLYPGGILNTGFALSWAKDRVHDALPASPTGGQPWAYERIQNGDTTCKENQELHPEAVDLLTKIDENKYYNPAVADPLAPVNFVHKIHRPVFLACQWTDEQTGGHCGDLASRLTGTPRKFITFTNGTHIDSLDPVTFNRWYDFLKLYVAQQAPGVPAAARARADDLRHGDGRPERQPAGRPDPGDRGLRRGEVGLRGAEARADPVRHRRRGQRARRAGGRVRAVLRPLSAAGHVPALVLLRDERDAARLRAFGRRRGLVHLGQGGTPRDLVRGQHRPGRPVGHHAGLHAGSRTPRARPSPT